MAHFTEEAIREQQRQLDNLREQLSRANALFEAQKKQLGITDADIEQGGAHAALKLSALSLVRETLDPRGSCTPEQRDFCAALYTLYEAVRTWEAAG